MFRIPVRPSSATVLVALTVAFVVAAGNAQGPGGGLRPLPDEPQVFTSQEQSFRVVPIKGLAHPWGLAFLPNGDILVTERAGRRTFWYSDRKQFVLGKDISDDLLADMVVPA